MTFVDKYPNRKKFGKWKCPSAWSSCTPPTEQAATLAVCLKVHILLSLFPRNRVQGTLFQGFFKKVLYLVATDTTIGSKFLAALFLYTNKLTSSILIIWPRFPFSFDFSTATNFWGTQLKVSITFPGYEFSAKCASSLPDINSTQCKIRTYKTIFKISIKNFAKGFERDGCWRIASFVLNGKQKKLFE